MPGLIHRNVTRTILNTAESTFQTQTPNSDTLPFALTTTDTFYIGYQRPFTTRHFQFPTANTNATTISVKTWDGDQYEDVLDIVDQTRGFSRNGYLSWTNTGRWQKVAQPGVDDVELFWAEITVSADLSAGTELQSLLNLYCDQELLSAYYPELVSDSRYLPTGQTDFIKQIFAATELVNERLIQDGLIVDESQLIDLNLGISVACAHATAFIIRDPISLDELDRERAAQAFRNFNRALNKGVVKPDVNRTGILEEAERRISNSYIGRGPD